MAIPFVQGLNVSTASPVGSTQSVLTCLSLLAMVVSRFLARLSLPRRLQKL